jgi:glutamate-1-semialdehyde 2,1-aminomutase
MKGHARGVGARWAIYFGVENPDDDYDFRKIATEFDRSMDRKFVTEALSYGLWFHDTSAAITPGHRALLTAHTEADIDETLEKMDAIFNKIK